MQSYLHDLSSKLKPGGVGFLHHSNIAHFGIKDREIDCEKPSLAWRKTCLQNCSESTVRKRGFHSLTQEIIAWETAS